MHRQRRGSALLLATALALTACGSYLSDDQLLSANDAEFRLTNGPDGSAQAGAGRPVATAAPTGSEGEAPSSAAPVTGGAGVGVGGQAGTTGAASSSGAPAGRSGAAPGSPGGATPAQGNAAGAGGAGPGNAGGGSGSGAVATPGPGAGALPGLQSDGSVIKLGSIAVRSGPLGAAMQPAIDAARAWVNDINARGGLAGHPVELVTVDDRGDPSTALALARRLVEQDGVLAIYGTGMPTTEQAVAPYLLQKGVPIIGGCICNTQVDDSQIVFQVGYGSKKGLSWAQLAPVLDGSDKRKAACPVLPGGPDVLRSARRDPRLGGRGGRPDPDRLRSADIHRPARLHR